MPAKAKREETTGALLARAFAVLADLAYHARTGVTIHELCERHHLGRRTAYRYLDAIQGAGFPLVCEQAPTERQRGSANTRAWRILGTALVPVQVLCEHSDLTIPERLVRIGERVAALRKSRGWTCRELARRAGIGDATLYNLECANKAPRIDTLLRLAETLGVDVRELF